MDLHKWISLNNDELMDIALKVCKNQDDYMDLYQCVMEQMLNKNTKFNEMKDKEKTYFFISMLKRNYFSKTSPYHYQFKKGAIMDDITDDLLEGVIDVEYSESIPDMEWVKLQLLELDWFDRDLFNLWVELGSLSNVSKKTNIPVNSVGKYIKEIKQELKIRWQQLN
jgi:DNA-directed RNA polymerase specialized sigma24 family protein